MAWVFEEKFNSDTKSTGDLNGQDSWVGGTGTDVVTTSPYEGDQCISLGAEGSMVSPTFTAVSSGVLYFAMKASSLSDASFDLRVGTNIRVRFTMYDSGGFKAQISNGGTPTQVITSVTSGQWYVIEITLNSDDTHAVRYHNGTSWSTPITGLAANTGGGGSVTNIRLNSGTPTTVYFDIITPTNPVNTSVTVSPSAQVDTFSIPAPTVKRGLTLFPSAQVDTFSTPAPTISLPKLVSVSPQVATFSIPSYAIVLAGIIVQALAQTLTFTLPAYQVRAYALVMPNGQTLTFTIPANTIVVEANVTISPTTLVLTFTTPSRTKVGSVWTKRGRSTNATWVRSTRNSN